IPEADAAFSVLLMTKFRTTLPLAAKFGTVRLADQMRAIYTSAAWPCEEEEWFVIYFARQGENMFPRALADREDRGCHRTVLGRVSRVLWNSIIAGAAMNALNDRDPEVAANAVLALANHGGPDVESLLWKKLEQWSEKWMGREAD